ncbi:Ribokinase [Chitinispirillum alkaliphilum]|nr:Ribokinase [Chitinispirillum alkaliphilum]
MKIPYIPQDGKDKISAFGSALVDLCILERDEFLKSCGASKGGMVLTDHLFIKSLLEKASSAPTIIPGGSACNTILGIGKLGGNACFIGKRGADKLGDLFEQGLREHNVESVLLNSEIPTGHVLSIITPDAQRSMFTFLGASADTKPEEISESYFKDTALVHFEGYLVSNRPLLLKALECAKSSGALISLDLASYTVVEQSKAFLDEIIDNYVDILIANEDEAAAFSGLSVEEEAFEYLASRAEIAVMKLGKRGSIIGHDGETIIIAPQGEGDAIDTTGAGDLWAAGFLYGLINGMSLRECGALGSECGFEVCQNIGAVIPPQGWERIKIRLQVEEKGMPALS